MEIRRLLDVLAPTGGDLAQRVDSGDESLQPVRGAVEHSRELTEPAGQVRTRLVAVGRQSIHGELGGDRGLRGLGGHLLTVSQHARCRVGGCACGVQVLDRGLEPGVEQVEARLRR